MARLFRLDGFTAGDLFGIIPPGDMVPRYYSIASNARDGMLEICVRKQLGGVCSEYLLGLNPGEQVDGFVRANPDFRPGKGKQPLVLIGSGAGIAPLIGFVRANTKHRPVHLYFGVRDPRSDFLYREEINQALASGHLTRLAMAFSRLLDGQYVQDRMIDDADQLRGLARQGARFMVCGSMAMGDGVRAVMDAVLEPLGLSVERLQASGRYIEDVY
jgi:sulfite reductase (NADPH) flavoprotein alpha-component